MVAEISDDLTICKGDEIVLKASGGTAYKWSNGATGSEVKVSPDKTTTYEVTVSDGLTSDLTEVTVTVNEVVADIGGDVSILKGEEITLSATGGDTYLWSTGETTQSIQVSPDISKFYSVTASAGSCRSIDKIKVTVITEGISVVAGIIDDQSICKGEEVTLTASGGTDYKWSNGATGPEVKVSPDNTTTYEVTVSDGLTSDVAEVTVAVNEVKAYAGKDVSIKKGEDITLKASGGDTYLWSTGETTQSITVSPDKTKTYGVTVSADGCEDIDKVTVKVESPSAPVVAEISDDLTICKGDEIVLKASGGTAYKWSNGATGSEVKVSPDKTTTYEVTVSDGLTSDLTEVTVTVNEVVADIGGDVSILKGEEITLSATGGDTYLWSTGETTQSIQVSPDISKFYSVTASAGSCRSIDKIKVTVITEGISVVAGIIDDQSICKGEEVTLTASGGTDYKWSNGATGPEVKVSPDNTTTYEVTVSDGLTSDVAEVTVAVNEVNANAGKDVSIKKGESIKLTATGGDLYKWSNGETSKSIIVSPLVSTDYEVQVERNGCIDSDTVKVEVSSLENSYITASAGKDVTICVGENVTLTASGGALYKWNNGETTKSISVNPVVTTTYSVEVSEGIRSGVDEVTVVVDNLEADAGNNITIMEGESVTLSANGGDRYQWSNGENTKSITISPKETKIYTVTVFKNGCQDSDSVQITVNKRPDMNELPPIAKAGEDVNICLGESVTLQAKGQGTFLWSTGDETAAIKVSPKRTTTYILKASNGEATVEDKVVVYVDNCGNDQVARSRIRPHCLSKPFERTNNNQYHWG